MFTDYHAIDLTYTLNEEVLSWNGDCGFKQHITLDYPEGCRLHQLAAMQAGIGTHMDVPVHFIPRACDIATIPVKNLVVPARVVDVSAQCYADYLISADDILLYEQQHGLIPPHHLIIFYPGWSRYWQEPNKYRNTDDTGMMHFPTLASDAAELVIARDCAGIAIDTLSPDKAGTAFPVHHLLLGANKYILENIANAEVLTAMGAYVIALPIKTADGTKAPAWVIGLIRK